MVGVGVWANAVVSGKEWDMSEKDKQRETGGQSNWVEVCRTKGKLQS